MLIETSVMSLTLQSPPRAMGSVSMQNMSPVGFSGSSLHTNPLQQGFRGIPARAGSDEAHMWLPAVWQPGETKCLILLKIQYSKVLPLSASTDRERLTRRTMVRYIMLQV